jgi:hypothetical protein
VKRTLGPLGWIVAACACGGCFYVFGQVFEVPLIMRTLAAVVFARLAYPASPKYVGALLWLGYSSFIGCWLFALGFLSDSSIFLTLAAAFVFEVGLYQAASRLASLVDPRTALLRGALAGLALLVLAHGLAYHEFRERLCVWLDRDRPAYLELDWPNTDCDTAVDALLRHASGEPDESAVWTYLRVRVAGGFDASTFSMPRARRTYQVTFGGVLAWLWILIQAGIVVAATAIAPWLAVLPADARRALEARPRPEPPETPPDPDEKLDDAWLQVCEALAKGQPAYLVMIQRFRAGGGYTLVGFAPDAESTRRALSGCGQRHPGFALECVAANDPRAKTRPNGGTPLERYELRIGAPLLIARAAGASYENAVGRTITIRDERRSEIVWTGNAKQSLGEARKLLAALPCAAVLALVVEIADSEGGSYAAYHQDRLDGIGRGE